jgi:hypothetical protein
MRSKWLIYNPWFRGRYTRRAVQLVATPLKNFDLSEFNIEASFFRRVISGDQHFVIYAYWNPILKKVYPKSLQTISCRTLAPVRNCHEMILLSFPTERRRRANVFRVHWLDQCSQRIRKDICMSAVWGRSSNTLVIWTGLDCVYLIFKRIRRFSQNQYIGILKISVAHQSHWGCRRCRELYINGQISFLRDVNPICTGGFSCWYDRGCADRAHPSEILSINCHYPISFIFSKFYLSLT